MHDGQGDILQPCIAPATARWDAEGGHPAVAWMRTRLLSLDPPVLAAAQAETFGPGNAPIAVLLYDCTLRLKN